MEKNCLEHYSCDFEVFYAKIVFYASLTDICNRFNIFSAQLLISKAIPLAINPSAGMNGVTSRLISRNDYIALKTKYKQNSSNDGTTRLHNFLIICCKEQQSTGEGRREKYISTMESK